MVARAVQDAIAIQHVLKTDIANPKTTPLARAALARAWATVQDSIRVMRGIPLPGQFRPDELPSKKARKGKLIEIAEAPAEAPEQPTAAATEPIAQPSDEPTTARPPEPKPTAADEQPKIVLDTPPQNTP